MNGEVVYLHTLHTCLVFSAFFLFLVSLKGTTLSYACCLLGCGTIGLTLRFLKQYGLEGSNRCVNSRGESNDPKPPYSLWRSASEEGFGEEGSTYEASTYEAT